MFDKILIANRGEIACRIARTARHLGVATVAIYSEADAHARHVEMADEAWPVGPPPALESYLAVATILDIANRSGAQAVHPGYGFLAENAAFAERCAGAGLAFVGPSPLAMRAMGLKTTAKDMMARVGVPTVPGFHAEGADDAALSDVAAHLGFPLLVKAAAGGGGRGMRVVRAQDEFAEAVASARREASAGFGDARLLLEKYLERPRHIEVQIFADAHGGAVAFPARDCSMQRHHQKIVEETPASNLSDTLASALRDGALAAARRVDYLGAGTVEFLVAGDAFYFLEMNTRLQVEHPVTEMISGVDLVEWQLRVASGERLPLSQEAIDAAGHAIEVRICAEDPALGFRPSVGMIEHYRPPAQSASVRLDDGVQRGDRITPYYDSLMAKLVVRADDREEALRSLRRALDEFEIAGVTTNLDFLRALAGHPAFIGGGYDTGFVERELEALTIEDTAPDPVLLLAVASAVALRELEEKAQHAATQAADPHSPWATSDGWRLFETASHAFLFEAKDGVLSAKIARLDEKAFRLEAQGRQAVVEAVTTDDRMRIRIDGVARSVGVVRRARGVIVIVDGRNHAVDFVDPLRPPAQGGAADARLDAPIPARVTRVLTQPGDTVEKGAPLILLEAMKMEFTLTAPRDGVVSSVHCAEGDMTQEGARLVELAEAVQ